MDSSTQSTQELIMTLKVSPEIRPKISVLMCAFNTERFISKAIESALNQEFKDFELLIIDDASTDQTGSIVQKYLFDSRIKYFKNVTNLGLARNRNRGLNEARGEYIAILDSDDMWVDKTKLNKQVKFLEENSDCGVIGTFGYKINDNEKMIGKIKYETKDGEIRKRILMFHQFLHSSVVYRRSAIEEAGQFDENLAPAEDYDLILKIGTKHSLANLPIFAVNYQLHQSNTSSNERRKRVQHAKLHLKVIIKYKRYYSNYFLALAKAYARVIFYFLLPSSLFFYFKHFS